MFAKTLAIAIVLSGTAGAAASYVQHNPVVPMETIWREATAFRPPLAPPPKPVAKYVPGKHYRFCRNEFREMMSKLSQAERRNACKCFDRHFQTWSPELQQASKLVLHGTAAFTMDPSKRDPAQQLRGSNTHNLSGHQRQVLIAQSRDQAWRFQKNMQKSFSRDAVSNAFANPLMLFAANFRIDRVANKCGMTDTQAGLRNAPKAFERIGTEKP
jgi:hypothetical protein